MKRLRAFLLALICLPALVPLLRGGFFASDDGLFHVYRAAALADAWQQGVLHPRLFPDFGFGYGQAVLNFYAPLAYWPPALLSLLGISPSAAVEITFALGFVLAALAAYGFARSLWGPWGGLLAAVAYTYFPYHLADVYVRGALPEHLAFIWPPLILWALTAVFRSAQLRPPLLWGALAWAGLVYTHNLTALLMLPVAILYAALLAGWTREPRRLLHAAAMLALGLGLSAPLWLPYFAESRFVGLALGPSDGYKAHLAPLGQLVQAALFYRYRERSPVVSPDALRADYPLSWIVVALLVFAFGLWVWRGRRQTARPIMGFGLLLVVVATLMTSAASLPIWEPLTPVLGSLQYPWRFMVLVAVGLIPIAAALPGLLDGLIGFTEHPERKGVAQPGKAWLRRTQSKDVTPATTHPSTGHSSSTALSRSPAQDASIIGLILVILAVLLLIQPLPHLPLDPVPFTAADAATPDRMWQEDHTAGQVGATWTGEFLPLTVTEQRWALGRPREGAIDTPAPAARPVVTVERAGYDSLALAIETGEPLTLRLHQFHLPMWRASLNRVEVATYPTDELGLVSVDVPAGRQSVALRFGPSRSWHVAGAVAGLAVLAWAMLAWATHAGAWAGQPARPGIRYAAVALVLAALVLVLNGWGVGRRSWTPQPAQTAVGDVALLVGYDVAPVRDALDVTLYWYALREVGTNYKVFVHALGSDGGPNDGLVIGQHDGDPVGGFTPTTRWRAGEVIVDRHRVPLPAGLSGEVGIRAGMYQPEPLQNLPLDPPTVDGRADLGTVRVP